MQQLRRTSVLIRLSTPSRAKAIPLMANLMPVIKDIDYLSADAAAFRA